MVRIVFTGCLKDGLFNHTIEFGTAAKALTWLEKSKHQEFQRLSMVDNLTGAQYQDIADMRQYLVVIVGRP